MVDDDGRTDDDEERRTPDHGHPISSPCEPNGSGELIMRVNPYVLNASDNIILINFRSILFKKITCNTMDILFL